MSGGRCNYWLSELARQGGVALRCSLEAGHDGEHKYGTREEYVYICKHTELRRDIASGCIQEI